MTVVDSAGTLVHLLDSTVAHGTGCLCVTDESNTRSGRVYVRDRKIYAVHVDGFIPKIGQRLRTGNMLDEAAFLALTADCDGDVFAAATGEKAVLRGLISQEMLDAVYRELMLSAIGAMFTWLGPRARFKRADTDHYVIPGVSVQAVIKAVGRRRDRWNELWSQMALGLVVESSVPVVVGNVPAGAVLPHEAMAVVAAADGTRTLDEVAGECGLTRFEIGHVLSDLVAAGVATIAGAPEAGRGEEPVRGTAEVAVAPGEPGDPAAVGPNFAPDVLSALSTVPEPDEPSAWAAGEVALPDGMDLGSLPPCMDAVPAAAAPALVGLVPPVLPGASDAAGSSDQMTQPQMYLPEAAPDTASVPVPIAPTPDLAAFFATAASPTPGSAPELARVSVSEPEIAPNTVGQPSIEPNLDEKQVKRLQAQVDAAEAALAAAEQALALTEQALNEHTVAADEAARPLDRVTKHLYDPQTDYMRMGDAGSRARWAHLQTAQANAGAVIEQERAEAALHVATRAYEEAVSRTGAILRTLQDLESRANATDQDLANALERVAAYRHEVDQAMEQASVVARASERLAMDRADAETAVTEARVMLDQVKALLIELT